MNQIRYVAICSEYGDYTHHFPSLPHFHQTLVSSTPHICDQSPLSHSPLEAHIADIHYISSSVPKRTRYHPQYRGIRSHVQRAITPIHYIPYTSSYPEDNNTYPLTVPPNTSQYPLYSHIFHCDEDILEELTTLDLSWNSLHHHTLFLSQETFHPPT
jgi:hypothetical protein